MTEYFMSSGGRYGNLWKRENNEDYFYSLKQLDWIKCAYVMVMPDFTKITESAALDFIRHEKELGTFSDEILPVRYFLSDIDIVYALDVLGNSYNVLKDKTLKPSKTKIDCMWGGIGANELDNYLK